MYNKELDDLFQRYRDNTLTEEELYRLFELLQAHEHDEQLKAILEQHWEAAIGVHAGSGRQPVRMVPRKRNAVRLSIAAAVLCCLSAGAYFLHAGHRPAAMSWQVENNAAGQPPRRLELPDHSVVWLNAGTTLQYQPGFAGSTREVRLEGEACFDVAPDAGKPFEVKTGPVSTRVLGTRFNISNYPADRRLAIAVLSGQVMVQDSNGTAPLLLRARQATSYQGGRFTGTTLEDSTDVAWIRGELVFHKTPLFQVVRVLETRFNKKIIIADALQNCVFYGEFNQETLPDILASMAVALNGQARETNGVWHIDGKGCF